MLAVTEAAGAYMARMLTQQGFPEEIGIRLFQEERGITMHPDCERSGDAVITIGDRVVLLLDSQMSKRLAKDTLDLDGKKLTLIRAPQRSKAEEEEEKIDCQKHWL
ncbi:MAG: hypothetical protein KAY37_04595 [Phycisphaerae bacterium]|nr:hypothetical protein [Phycisphaerae bacterium]